MFVNHVLIWLVSCGLGLGLRAGACGFRLLVYCGLDCCFWAL